MLLEGCVIQENDRGRKKYKMKKDQIGFYINFNLFEIA